MSKPIAVSALVLSLFALLALPAAGLAAPPEGAGLVVSPPSLAFEKTTVGDQSPGREVDLFNEGEETVAIDKIAIAGEDAASFSLSGGSCAPLWQNGHCAVWLAFTPDSPGEKHAFGVVSFKDGRPVQSFAISGSAVEPRLTFSPSSYDFGLQRVYEGRNANLQLTNSGEAAVQVDNIEMVGGSGSFWYGNTNCWSQPLQPGDSCGIEVDFNAQDALAYTARLRVSSNGYGFTADLSGEGGRAILEAVPNPADFGAVTVGAEGQAQTITLTNSGNIAASFFIGIVAGGDSASFQLLSESCTGAELAPSSSCTARVRFRPQEAGPKAAYMAFFGDNDGGAVVALKGEGVAAAVTLAPSAFDFGTEAAGGGSASHAFAVRNDGGTALELGAVAIVGADLDQFALAGDECTGAVLAPGGECLVRVRFAPGGAGAKAARLRVGSDSGAFLAALAGTGVEPAAAADRGPDAALAQPGSPPRPWRHGRHRRFVRGETLSAARLQRPRRAHVRASTIPR